MIKIGYSKYSMPVYADMCADLFHSGHVSFLKRCHEIARADDTTLLIGIHSDEEIESYKRSPVLTMSDRVAVVRSCKYVDEVIENASVKITDAFLNKHNITKVIHAHSESEHEKYANMYTVPMSRNMFHRLDYSPHISTTQIIEKIVNSRSI